MRYLISLIFSVATFAQTTNVTVTVTFPNAAIADVLTWNRTQLADPAPVGALTGSLTSGATTFTLSSATGYSSGQTVLIDSEEITCTTLTGTVYSGCTRGVQTTTAAAHSAGALAHIMKYGNNSALVKALLMPGVQTVLRQLGVNSTYISALQSSVASSQTALDTALGTAVQ